jgi:peptidoglycan/LPS O-acetylase OafA/YrhL
MSSKSMRIEGLDVLRGLAAGAVMLFHNSSYYDVLYPGREGLPFTMASGHFGVELFFIISGFVILMTVIRSRTLYDFVASRVARLVPAFWAAAFLTAMVIYIRPMPPWFVEPPVAMVLSNLTLVPGLLSQKGIDMPYWTLSYEIVFYTILAATLAAGFLKRLELACLLWLALNFIVLVTDTHLYLRLNILLLIHYGNFFIIGMCLYRMYSREATVLTYVVLTASIATTLLGGGRQAFFTPGPLYFVLTVGLAGLVWLTVRYNPRWMNIWPLLFLGRISYSLYLIHNALGYEIISMVQDAGGPPLLGIALASTGSLLAATLLNVLVERPGQERLRALFASNRDMVLRLSQPGASRI